jgi:hypothetical protein
MSSRRPLRVVILKPSKYARDGYVERFRRGFMPNATIAHIASLTPHEVNGADTSVETIDEYVHTDLRYLDRLRVDPSMTTLLALVGVQSHQLHRALDLAAFARARGVEHCVIGGPHPLTCDTSALHGRGVAFALAEAELVWPAILDDAASGALAPVYGAGTRWQARLDPPVLVPPGRRDLRRYAAPFVGIYPARGCPFDCNFCSVIKIAGRTIRSQPVATTLASLEAAQAAGVRYVIFTSDNFNKYPEATALLEAMIAERIRLPFFVQCDVQIERQEPLVALLARAGCLQMFVGVESFSPEALAGAHKRQNHPERYSRIVELCRAYGVTSHFSNILGFPTDTENTILEHLAQLQALDPDLASFYLLTPIPGTDQYADFRARDWITANNLDRFDGTAVTWRHPHLAPARWEHLLHRAYRDFFRPGAVARRLGRAARRHWDFRTPGALASIGGYALQSRLAVRARTHPMAGGLGRVRRDHACDYAALRRRTWDTDLVPLPANLAPPVADDAVHQRGATTPLAR